MDNPPESKHFAGLPFRSGPNIQIKLTRQLPLINPNLKLVPVGVSSDSQQGP